MTYLKKTRYSSYLFILSLIVFAVTHTGCPPTADPVPDEPQSTEGELESIEVDTRWKADFTYDAQGHVTGIDWDNGDHYTCSYDGNFLSKINLFNGRDVLLNFDKIHARLLSSSDETSTLKQIVHYEYVGSEDQPREVIGIVSVLENGEWKTDTIYRAKNIAYDANGGITSCLYTTYNGGFPYSDYDVTCTTEDEGNSLWGNIPYLCLPDFIEGSSGLCKLSKRSVTKVIFKNVSTQKEQIVLYSNAYSANPRKIIQIMEDNGFIAEARKFTWIP